MRLFWFGLVAWITGFLIIAAVWIMQVISINTGETAMFFGINLGNMISAMARWTYDFGKGIDWSYLTDFYFSAKGPLATDPFLDPATPYIWRILVGWFVLGAAILLILLLLATLLSVVSTRVVGSSSASSGGGESGGPTTRAVALSGSTVIFILIILISFWPAFTAWNSAREVGRDIKSAIADCGGPKYDNLDYELARDCLGPYKVARQHAEMRTGMLMLETRLGQACMHLGQPYPQDEATQALVLEMAVSGISGCPSGLIAEAKRLGMQSDYPSSRGPWQKALGGATRLALALIGGYVFLAIISHAIAQPIWPMTANMQKTWAAATLVLSVALFTVF